MLLGNQLEKALIKVGLADTPKPRKKPRHKKFTCHVCGSPMQVIENTNTMACTNDQCKQYFIFDNQFLMGHYVGYAKASRIFNSLLFRGPR